MKTSRNLDISIHMLVLVHQKSTRMCREVVEIDQSHAPSLEIVDIDRFERNQFDLTVAGILINFAVEAVHRFRVAFKDLEKSVSREQKKPGDFIAKIVLGGSLDEHLDSVVGDDLPG